MQEAFGTESRLCSVPRLCIFRRNDREHGRKEERTMLDMWLCQYGLLYDSGRKCLFAASPEGPSNSWSQAIIGRRFNGSSWTYALLTGFWIPVDRLKCYWINFVWGELAPSWSWQLNCDFLVHKQYSSWPVFPLPGPCSNGGEWLSIKDVRMYILEKNIFPSNKKDWISVFPDDWMLCTSSTLIFDDGTHIAEFNMKV